MKLSSSLNRARLADSIACRYFSRRLRNRRRQVGPPLPDLPDGSGGHAAELPLQLSMQQTGIGMPKGQPPRLIVIIRRPQTAGDADGGDETQAAGEHEHGKPHPPAMEVGDSTGSVDGTMPNAALLQSNQASTTGTGARAGCSSLVAVGSISEASVGQSQFGTCARPSSPSPALQQQQQQAGEGENPVEPGISSGSSNSGSRCSLDLDPGQGGPAKQQQQPQQPESGDSSMSLPECGSRCSSTSELPYIGCSMASAAQPHTVLGLPQCVAHGVLERLDLDGQRVLRAVSRGLYFEASRHVRCLTVCHDNLETLISMPLHQVGGGRDSCTWRGAPSAAQSFCVSTEGVFLHRCVHHSIPHNRKS